MLRDAVWEKKAPAAAHTPFKKISPRLSTPDTRTHDGNKRAYLLEA
jgi:hypothetical protein